MARESIVGDKSLYAQSRKDFISKLHIALKEAGETDYWLDVIHSAEYFTDDEFQSLKADNFPSKREQRELAHFAEREEGLARRPKGKSKSAKLTTSCFDC